MDSRLIRNGLLLFIVAYAQTTPLFAVAGVKVNVALVIAVLIAFSVRTLYECAFLSVCVALGLASGAGFVQALLFFLAVFFSAYILRIVLPWQPFLSALTLALFFTALSSISLDWEFFIRYAPQFARETLYNGITLAVLYAFISHYHARQGRY